MVHTHIVFGQIYGVYYTYKYGIQIHIYTHIAYGQIYGWRQPYTPLLCGPHTGPTNKSITIRAQSVTARAATSNTSLGAMMAQTNMWERRTAAQSTAVAMHKTLTHKKAVTRTDSNSPYLMSNSSRLKGRVTAAPKGTDLDPDPDVG
jgi:hypothetical protein